MNNAFSAADRLELLLVRGVTVSLNSDGDLDVEGPAVVVDAAIPMLIKYKTDIADKLDAKEWEAA